MANFNGVEHKGVYPIAPWWFIDKVGFNKKYFPNKEDAIKKFREIFGNSDIKKIKESEVKFLFYKRIDDYELRTYEICWDFFEVDEGEYKNASKCWVIEIDMHWGDEFKEDGK